MVEPLFAVLVEELASYSADAASETVVVGLFAEQVEIAVACALVHRRLARAVLGVSLHSIQNNSSSHVCCASCILQLSGRDHHSPDKRRPCMVSICIRCPKGANADRVYRGLVAHTILQQLLEVTSSHSPERVAAAVLVGGIEGWEQRVAAADEMGSAVPVLGLQGDVRQAPEAGLIVVARRFVDAETPPFALCCSMAAAVAAAVGLERVLADCAADLGRQPLAAAAPLVSDCH